MTEPPIVRELVSSGHSVRLDGDTLVVKPAMAKQLREKVRSHKPEIVEFLRAQDEWRVEGCPRFTILAGADEAEAARGGCCVACGASIELHGSTASPEWRRVDDLDDVELVAVRYVLASATAIARGAR